MMMSLPYSMAVIFLPISPMPPKKMTLTGGLPLPRLPRPLRWLLLPIFLLVFIAPIVPVIAAVRKRLLRPRLRFRALAPVFAAVACRRNVLGVS